MSVEIQSCLLSEHLDQCADNSEIPSLFCIFVAGRLFGLWMVQSHFTPQQKFVLKSKRFFQQLTILSDYSLMTIISVAVNDCLEAFQGIGQIVCQFFLHAVLGLCR